MLFKQGLTASIGFRRLSSGTYLGPRQMVSASWLMNQLSPYASSFWLLVSFLSMAVLYFFWRRLATSWRLGLWGAHRVLIPYFGLLIGALSPRLMGLSNIDWLVSLSFGLGLIFAVLVLLLLVRATVDLTDPGPYGEADRTRDPNTGKTPSLHRRGNIAWQLIGASVLLSGIEEFHWSFLRGAIWEMLLSFPVPPALPTYWAVWLAAAIAALDMTLRRPNFAQWLLQLTILTTTSVLFLYTRNFWLCWALHAAAQLIVAPGGTIHYAENHRMQQHSP